MPPEAELAGAHARQRSSRSQGSLGCALLVALRAHPLFAGYDRPGHAVGGRPSCASRGEPKWEERSNGGRSQRDRYAGGGGGRARRRSPRPFASPPPSADEVAIRTKEDAFTITWGELRERVDALAGGLAELGLRRGDTLALMLSNRPEFHLCDLAAMMLGATPFSIYNTYTAEQIRYLIDDADAKILICEQQFLPQVLEAREQLPGLEHVIVVDGEAPRRRRSRSPRSRR